MTTELSPHRSAPHPPAPTEDEEPDHRFSLANERTFLAWTRTALATLAAGVAVVQLLPGLGAPRQRLVIGLFLIGLAFVIAIGGYLRWRRVQQAMRRGRPLPHTSLPAVVAAALSVVMALAVTLLLTTVA